MVKDEGCGKLNVKRGCCKSCLSNKYCNDWDGKDCLGVTADQCMSVNVYRIIDCCDTCKRIMENLRNLEQDKILP